MNNTEPYSGRRPLSPQPNRGPEWHEELPHDSYYYTGFWGSYKGYVKGMLGGMLIGAMLGGVIGLGAAAAAVIVGGSLIPFGAIAGSFALAFGLLGTIKGFHEFSTIGSNAGVGVALDEFEVRINRSIDSKLNNAVKKIATLEGKEKDLPAISAAVEAEADVITPAKMHSDAPHVDSATARSTKLFHMKIALLGIVLGVAAGALICFAAPPLLAGTLATEGLFTALAGIVGHATELGALTHVAGGAVAAKAGMAAIITACGLFGASFGLDRIMFRRVFDFTDKLFEGRVLPKNLVAESPILKRSKAMEVPTIPVIPPPPGVETVTEKNTPEKEQVKSKEWAQKVRAEQVLKGFDHTQAPMH